MRVGIGGGQRRLSGQKTVTDMPSDRTVRAYCPNCGPGTRADVMGEYERRYDDPDGDWTNVTHRILKCCGCEVVYHQQESVSPWDRQIWDEEIGQYVLEPKFDYWPAPCKRQPPDWFDELGDRVLQSLLAELYGAFNSGYQILAAIGVRTAFDRATERLGINPSLTFAEKLRAAKARGHLGDGEATALEGLVDAGSAAAHRGWKPGDEALSAMVDSLEAFLRREFVTNPKMQSVSRSVPPKPPRPTVPGSEGGINPRRRV